MAIPASRQIPRITKKFFRNPVGNSNGLEENGVQIVKLIVDLYLNSAKMMDISIKMNALINSPLTHRKNTKGTKLKPITPKKNTRLPIYGGKHDNRKDSVSLEENILNLIQKHMPPHLTKSELLSAIKRKK